MLGTQEDHAHFADTVKAFVSRIGKGRGAMLTRVIISDIIFEDTMDAWLLCFQAEQISKEHDVKLPQGIVAAQVVRESKVEVLTESELWQMVSKMEDYNPTGDADLEELRAIYENSTAAT